MLEPGLIERVETMASRGVSIPRIGTLMGYTGAEWFSLCEQHPEIGQAFAKGLAEGENAALEQLGTQSKRGKYQRYTALAG
jgi:hypothetical protein